MALSVISGIFILVAAIIGNIDVFPREYLVVLFPLILLGIVYFLIELKFCDAAMKMALPRDRRNYHTMCYNNLCKNDSENLNPFHTYLPGRIKNPFVITPP